MEKTLLCEHIVHQQFGPHVGRIATLLLEKGRLTLSELVRLSSRTCSAEGHVLLSPHFVRSALAVLVQHNIVWFTRTMTNDAIHRRARAEEFGLMQNDHYIPHDSEEFQGTVFYEINSDEIVARLRFPHFLVIAEKLAEGTSKGLLQVVLAHGKLAIGDLLTIYAQDDSAKREEAYNVLDWMLKRSYLIPAIKSANTKAADRYLEREKIALDKITSGPTTKAYKSAQKEAVEAVSERQDAEMKHAREKMFAGPSPDRHGSSSSFKPSSSKSGSKRKMDVDDEGYGPRKRRTYDSSLDESVVIRVNNDRFMLKIRNKVIEDAFRNYYGKAAELVIRAALSIIEDRCEGDPAMIDLLGSFSDPFSTTSVLERMGSLTSSASSKKGLQEIVRSAFHEHEMQTRSSSRYSSYDDHETWNPKRENTASFVRELLGNLSCAGEDPVTRGKSTPCWLRPAIINVSEEDLDEDADDTSRFNYANQGSDGSEKWVIDFHKVQLDMKRQLAYSIIRDKFWNQSFTDRESGVVLQGNETPGKAGKEAVRIMRILDTHGKLQENHIFKIAMISQKDCRKWIFDLARFHFIQQQEIPKTTDRAIARTFFLWFVDWNKTNHTLEKMLYQALGNIETRKEQEKQPWLALLAKSQRPEVQADSALLREDEWKNLSDLQRKLRDLQVGQWRILSDLLVLQLRERDSGGLSF